MKKGFSFDGCFGVGAVLLWTFVFATTLVFGENPTDSAYFAYIGRCLNAGRHLYVDIWDCKGPFLYWTSALGVWLNPVWGFRVLFALFWALDLALFYLLAKRRGGSPGLAVFLFALFAFGSGTDRFLVIGRQEALGALVILSALHLNRFTARRRFADIAIGVCGGVAFMIKPTFAAFALCLLVRWILDAAQDRNWREFGFRVGCAVLGGLFVLAVCTAVYWPDHIAEFWNGALLWNLTERSVHSSHHWLSQFVPGDVHFRRHGWTLVVLFPLAAAALALAWRRTSKDRPLAIWILVELLLLLACACFFGYYAILPSIPVVLILSANCSRRWLSVMVILAALVFFRKGVPSACRYLAAARDRTAEREAIREIVRAHPGPVAVCGGNLASDVLNRLNLFSEQTYTFWEAWVESSADATHDMMCDDFNRALTNPRCRVIIACHPLKYMVKRGASAKLLKRFRPAFKAPHLRLTVFADIMYDKNGE